MDVLIIDDDPCLRGLVVACLRRVKGVRTLTASSGEDGVLLAITALPDLIILDVNMPKLDGLGTLRALRAGGIAVPVLFLTAQSGGDELLLQTGAAGVIHKPFKHGALVSAVTALLPPTGGVPGSVDDDRGPFPAPEHHAASIQVIVHGHGTLPGPSERPLHRRGHPR